MQRGVQQAAGSRKGPFSGSLYSTSSNNALGGGGGSSYSSSSSAATTKKTFLIFVLIALFIIVMNFLSAPAVPQGGAAGGPPSTSLASGHNVEPLRGGRRAGGGYLGAGLARLHKEMSTLQKQGNAISSFGGQAAHEHPDDKKGADANSNHQWPRKAGGGIFNKKVLVERLAADSLRYPGAGEKFDGAYQREHEKQEGKDHHHHDDRHDDEHHHDDKKDDKKEEKEGHHDHEHHHHDHEQHHNSKKHHHHHHHNDDDDDHDHNHHHENKKETPNQVPALFRELQNVGGALKQTVEKGTGEAVKELVDEKNRRRVRRLEEEQGSVVAQKQKVSSSLPPSSIEHHNEHKDEHHHRDDEHNNSQQDEKSTVVVVESRDEKKAVVDSSAAPTTVTTGVSSKNVTTTTDAQSPAGAGATSAVVASSSSTSSSSSFSSCRCCPRCIKKKAKKGTDTNIEAEQQTCSMCNAAKLNKPCYLARCPRQETHWFHSLDICGGNFSYPSVPTSSSSSSSSNDGGDGHSSSSSLEKWNPLGDFSSCDCPEARDQSFLDKIAANDAQCDPYQWRSDIEDCAVQHVPYVPRVSVFPLLVQSVIACYGSGDMVCKVVGKSGGWESELSSLLIYAMGALRYDRVRRKWLDKVGLNHFKDLDVLWPNVSDPQRPVMDPKWFQDQLDNEAGVEYLDLGANVGAFTFLMWKERYNVHAFEALPHNVQLLSMSKCLNLKLAKPEMNFQLKKRRRPTMKGADGSLAAKAGEDFEEGGAAHKNPLDFLDKLFVGQEKDNAHGNKDDNPKATTPSPPVAVVTNTIDIHHAALGDQANLKCVMISQPNNYGDTHITCNQSLVNSPEGEPVLGDYVKRGYLHYTTLDSFVRDEKKWSHDAPGFDDKGKYVHAMSDEAKRKKYQQQVPPVYSSSKKIKNKQEEDGGGEAKKDEENKNVKADASPSSPSPSSEVNASMSPISNTWQYKDYVIKLDVEGNEVSVMNGAHWFLSQPFRPKLILSEVWKKINITRYGEMMIGQHNYIGFALTDKIWMKTVADVAKFHTFMPREMDTILWLVPGYEHLFPEELLQPVVPLDGGNGGGGGGGGGS